MQSITTAKYIRISPKKTSFLVASIRKLSPKLALERLAFAKDKESFVVGKIIKSALADATNNLKLNEDKLKFASIQIGKGPVFKRWQPVARGMAHSIKKRTAHIKIILEEVNPNTKVRNSKQINIPKLPKPKTDKK